MRKLTKIASIATLFLGLAFGNYSYANAQESTDYENKVEEQILNELTAYFEENSIPVELSDINCVINYDQYDSTEDINASVSELTEKIKSEFNNTNVKINTNSSSSMIQPLSIENNGGNDYTAKVESIVPAIGWGYICQDFTAKVSGGKISSLTLEGSSYDTGITLGSWEESRTWKTISTNKKYCQIHMKGTVGYLWKDLNLSFSSTFLATGKVSGSKIVSALYDEWPD